MSTPKDTQSQSLSRLKQIEQKLIDADRTDTVDVGKLHDCVVREQVEPSDGFEPIPNWMVAFYMVLLFWGGWYLATYSGGWDANVLDENPAARFAALAAANTPPDPMEVGRRLYLANCVSCHQAAGQGVAGQYPPLAASEWVIENPQRLKRILLQGLEGPIVVLGNTYNGNMPAFNRLRDDQIASILTYIRNSFGNSAGPITAEQVAATRTATTGRNAAWTAPELLAITDPDL